MDQFGYRTGEETWNAFCPRCLVISLIDFPDREFAELIELQESNSPQKSILFFGPDLPPLSTALCCPAFAMQSFHPWSQAFKAWEQPTVPHQPIFTICHYLPNITSSSSHYPAIPTSHQSENQENSFAKSSDQQYGFHSTPTLLSSWALERLTTWRQRPGRPADTPRPKAKHV